MVDTNAMVRVCLWKRPSSQRENKDGHDNTSSAPVHNIAANKQTYNEKNIKNISDNYTKASESFENRKQPILEYYLQTVGC